jgi:hypothetical protein
LDAGGIRIDRHGRHLRRGRGNIAADQAQHIVPRRGQRVGECERDIPESSPKQLCSALKLLCSAPELLCFGLKQLCSAPELLCFGLKLLCSAPELLCFGLKLLCSGPELLCFDPKIIVFRPEMRFRHFF